MNRQIKIIIVLAFSLIFFECEDTDVKSPESGFLSTYNFSGTDIKEGDSVVTSSKHGPGLNLIPASRKKQINNDMTIKEVLNILGPGFMSKLSGNGGVTWYFDDGTSIGYGMWTEINKTPKWIKNIRLPITSQTEKASCAQWMGVGFGSSEYKTDKFVNDSCDDRTFKVLDHEYAKDKKFVYYKPRPNANNMTVIIRGADSKTFKLLKRCSGYAIDKTHVYSMGKIVKDKDPNIFKKFDPSNPETFCY